MALMILVDGGTRRETMAADWFHFSFVDRPRMKRSWMKSCPGRSRHGFNCAAHALDIDQRGDEVRSGLNELLVEDLAVAQFLPKPKKATTSFTAIASPP